MFCIQRKHSMMDSNVVCRFGVERCECTGGKHLDSVRLTRDSLWRPFLFKKLLHCLAALTNSVSLPRAIDATRISLIQSRGAIGIKTNDESANAKWTCAAALGVLLLDTRNISSDVPARPARKLKAEAVTAGCDERWRTGGGGCLLYAWSVFERQPVTLALNTSVVDKNSAVSSETSEGDCKMRIQLGDFSDGVRLRGRREHVSGRKHAGENFICMLRRSPAATWPCFASQQQAQLYLSRERRLRWFLCAQPPAHTPPETSGHLEKTP